MRVPAAAAILLESTVGGGGHALPVPDFPRL